MNAPAQQPDERLLIEAAQKDPRRFAELYELNFERVYAFVARRVGSRDAAQDITSDVFQKALVNLRRFEWRGVPFTAWLLQIAANAVADHYKRAARTSGLPATDGAVENTGVATGSGGLQEIEERALLFRLVSALPADQRRVIEMRFAEEKSIREIAEELRRSGGAVKQLQFRGLANLRAQLEKNAGKMPDRKSARKLGGANG